MKPFLQRSLIDFRRALLDSELFRLSACVIRESGTSLARSKQVLLRIQSVQSFSHRSSTRSAIVPAYRVYDPRLVTYCQFSDADQGFRIPQSSYRTPERNPSQALDALEIPMCWTLLSLEAFRDTPSRNGTSSPLPARCHPQ